MLQPKKVPKAAVESTTQIVTQEMDKFATIAAGIVAEGASCRFYEKGIFNQKSFFYEHRHDLPLHYNAFVGEVGSSKVASSNVETVFSGVGGMLQKATTLGGDLVESYTICHYQWLYEWLCPTDDEIAEAYQIVHGKEAHQSDEDSSDAEADEDGDAEDEGGD